VFSHHNLGQTLVSVGQHAQALEFLRHAHEILDADAMRVAAGGDALFGAARGLGATPLLIMRRTTRYWMSKAESALGHFERALTYAEANDREMRDLGPASDALTIIVTTLSVGIPRLARGELDVATTILERALAAARDAGLAPYSAEAASHLGQAYALAGRHDEALALLTLPLESDFNQYQLPGHSLHLSRLAEAYWRAGQMVDAARTAAAALEASRTRKERGPEAATLRVIAEVAAVGTTSERRRAREQFAAAITLAERLGMDPLVAHGRLGLARLLHRDGHRSEARKNALIALTLYRGMAMHRWVSDAAALAGDRP
ncbi:MAG TPA: tetratricopeptide repeat protein, partial [Gemmatimonadaceae bacterium]|nr:tetratricopeptide repeat protein [Gemmatimonadaceae bacterium]